MFGAAEVPNDELVVADGLLELPDAEPLEFAGDGCAAAGGVVVAFDPGDELG